MLIRHLDRNPPRGIIFAAAFPSVSSQVSRQCLQRNAALFAEFCLAEPTNFICGCNSVRLLAGPPAP